MKRSLTVLVSYTQVTDFYNQINGFMTFDREVIKVDTEEMRRINMLFRDPARKPAVE